MTYIQGFVVPVPHARRDDYLAMAQSVAPLFAEFGALRTVECWGDDVPHGKRTDFHRAVAATEDEAIVFAWVVWPNRETCDAASEKMRADERMQPPADMPFDGKRMIFAGFAEIFDHGPGGAFGYIDGFVAPVPTGSRQAYLDHTTAMTEILAAQGCTRGTENWGEDVPAGTVTDFRRSVEATADETVVFSWLEWPDKATRDAGMAAMMADPRVHALAMPFDGARMIYGGFVPILDTDA